MKHVLVCHTGGTISMSVSPSTRSVKPLGSQAVAQILPHLDGHANVTMVDFGNLPSAHMNPARMNELRKLIEQHAGQGLYDGVVITHGTDTLEETAYFLDLTLSLPIPVVLTGAMRSSNEPGADGPANLVSAVRVAIDPASRNKGVLVVFNEEIHSARHVTKAHTSNVASFQSPNAGPIGTVTKQRVHYHHAPLQREFFPVGQVKANVPLLKAVTGMDPRWLQFLLNEEVDGVVIEAFGLGNLPPEVLPVLANVLSRGIPVVIVSRCYQGNVQDVYEYEGGGRQLTQMGMIFANGLNGQKARIKLMVALDQTRDFQKLQRFFEQ